MNHHHAADHIKRANHFLELAIEALRWARLTTDHQDVAELCSDLEKSCADIRARAKELRLLREAS